METCRQAKKQIIIIIIIKKYTANENRPAQEQGLPLPPSLGFPVLFIPSPLTEDRKKKQREKKKWKKSNNTQPRELINRIERPLPLKQIKVR
jgi:hypothetical protein